ncbi:MAG: c-type cytochrome [Bdellovibrionales bacterium]|nr:c-type cytochrome [Bdellovibrionales bacterium]
MSDDKENQSTEHFDGIVEHDHPLPRWWVAIFFATIIYGVIYYIHYESHSGPTTDQELAAGMQEIYQAQKSGVAETIDYDQVIKKPESIQAGAKIYSEKCFMCHGDKGQGLIGPNLTDNHWVHGKGTSQDILAVVQTGVAAKGMPAWESVLKPEEQAQVVAFVLSLKGTNPKNPKAPEGVEVSN